jgi:glutathionyl-hydroquinone reductase
VTAEAAGTRGDIAKALNQAAQTRLAEMQAAALDPEDNRSYAPLISFLNNYVYKGQAEAGFAIVKKAHAASPDALYIALQTYAEQVRQSQWLADLNGLNDGKLEGLLDQIDRPMEETP